MRSATADSTPRGFRTSRGQRPQHTPRGGRSDFSDRRRADDDSKKEPATVELMMPLTQLLIQLERIIYVLSNVFYKFSENNLESEMKMTMTSPCMIFGRKRVPGIYHIYFAILIYCAKTVPYL